MSELKPCPFCGGSDTVVEKDLITGTFVVQCRNCQTAVWQYYAIRQEAIEAWNTREGDKKMNGLKNCPFCNGEAEFYRGVTRVTKSENAKRSDYVVVRCKNCGAETNKVLYDKSKHGIDGEYDEAKVAWNRRESDGKTS